MAASVPNRTTDKSLRLAWQDAFLSALRETGVVRAACESSGVGRQTVYDLRNRDPEFAARWEEAMEDAADLLEQEAIRRARVGTREPVIYQGKPCGVWVNDANEVVPEGTPGSRLIPLAVTKYSDTLLIFLLKGIRPEKYRDTAPADTGDALGAVVRELIADGLKSRRNSTGGAAGDPGRSGEAGPAAGVADAPAHRTD